MSDQSSEPRREEAGAFDLKSAQNRLLWAAHVHNIEGIRKAMNEGADINGVHSATGLCALHIAVGHNDLPLCRFLIEQCGAHFFPDKFGRWPSLIAAECQVDDELSDYIVNAEARFLNENRPA